MKSGTTLISIACSHPALVTKALAVDSDATTDGNSQSNPGDGSTMKDEADQLADLLGGMGVAGGKACEVCFVKSVERLVDSDTC